MRDVDLFTRTVGSGPDVIVLHGGPGAHHDYLLPQFDRLATGRRLRYYDQRGGGRSAVPGDVPVGWEEHVADLDALIDYWDLAPATVLGYSWGGLLAMLHLVRHPDRVARVALVSSAPVWHEGRRRFEENFTARMQAPAVREARRRLQESSLRERDPEAYRRRAFELSVAGYFKNPTAVHELTPFRVTGRTQQAVWDSLGTYDLRDDLARRAIAARVFHGRHDPMPLDEAQRTADLLGAELVIFEESGHCPYVEETDRFVRELGAWLPAGT